MKPIPLHPISVLVGLALAGLVAISIGAAQTVQPIPTRTQIVGVVPAERWNYVNLNFPSAATYTVPSDRRFVVTFCDLFSTVYLNGIYAVDQFVPVRGGMGAYPSAETVVVLGPGESLSLMESGYARFWGYLEPL